MQNKTKYILFGAIALIAVILLVILLPKSEKRVSPEPLATSSLDTPEAGKPTPSETAAEQATEINPETTATATTTATTTANSAPANGAIGTWVSATKGKGIQGSGKATLNGILFQLSLAGDVTLVIQKVENNAGTGTITFNNVCVTGTKSVDGKAPTAFSPQCEKTYSQPAVMQIDGNKFSYAGKSDLGADISLTGTFATDSMTGTFTRTSTSGTITGTFNLIREK